MTRPTVSLTLLAALALPFAAVAQDVGQHPAVFAPRALPGVDSSTFIVGHPAAPRFVAGPQATRRARRSCGPPRGARRRPLPGAIAPGLARRPAAPDRRD